MTFLHPWALLPGFGAVPAVLWLCRWADGRRVADLRRFSAIAKMPEGTTDAPFLRYVLAFAAGLITVAAAQPVRNAGATPVARPAVDIVFLLDVSRSMFTRDRAQSRIEQARTAIGDVLDHAAEQRFGLVVFAGNGSVECPLTNDYGFLLAQLKKASRDSVTTGGTRTGDAIRFAARTAFDDASRNARELVLIGDGGDDDTSPESAAAELSRRGVRLVVAGVGDASAPGFVPASESDASPILFRGKPVTAKLDSEALQSICKAHAHCVYTTLPDTAFQAAVLDGSRNRPESGQALGPAGSTGSILALAAAVLLAGEYLLRASGVRFGRGRTQ